MNRPFHLNLDPWNREVVMISECEGTYVLEPMRFVTNAERKRQAKRKAA